MLLFLQAFTLRTLGARGGIDGPNSNQRMVARRCSVVAVVYTFSVAAAAAEAKPDGVEHFVPVFTQRCSALSATRSKPRLPSYSRWYYRSVCKSPGTLRQ